MPDAASLPAEPIESDTRTPAEFAGIPGKDSYAEARRGPTLCAFCGDEAATTERHDEPACGDCAAVCHHLGGIDRVDRHTHYVWECCECSAVVTDCPRCGHRMGEYGCCLGAL